MNTVIYAPPGHTRPFVVHFLHYDEPSQLVVLAKSPRHAVRVMFRYFETIYHTIDMINYDRKLNECYVAPLFYFSDSLYKHLKKQYHGNI